MIINNITRTSLRIKIYIWIYYITGWINTFFACWKPDNLSHKKQKLFVQGQLSLTCLWRLTIFISISCLLVNSNIQKRQQLYIFMVRVSKMDWMRHKWIFIEKIETWKSFLKSPLKITVRSFKWRKFSNRKYRFYTYGNSKLFYSSNGYNNPRLSLFHNICGTF